MNVGKASISHSDGATTSGNEKYDNVKPDKWRVLHKLVPPWLYHGMGVVFVETRIVLLSSGRFFDVRDAFFSEEFLCGGRITGVFDVPL